MTVLATAHLPCWQDPSGDTIEVLIEQRDGYKGISLLAGKFEVYLERDAERGLVVRIWRDTDSGGDADFEHEFPVAGPLPADPV